MSDTTKYITVEELNHYRNCAKIFNIKGFSPPVVECFSSKISFLNEKSSGDRVKQKKNSK